MSTTNIVFSDIDGTIMHEPNGEELPDYGPENLCLVTPPSTSGRQGVISMNTLNKASTLRKNGLKFVVISGARVSTILMRLPFLPEADAFVAETGGKIFYPGGPFKSACPLQEDLEWRASMEAIVGPQKQDALAPALRKGVLWDWYRSCQAGSWKLDANGYTTNFRVHLGSHTEEELQDLISRRPAEISCSFNLGMADFYPHLSGKLNAARWVAKKFGADLKSCVFLCDDDNDLELAHEVGRAFLPSISSASMAAAVKASPERFTKATKKGCAATEEMLDAVATYYGLEQP